MFGVNLKEIKSKLNLVSNKEFFVGCNDKNCKLGLGKSSDLNKASELFNTTNVVLKTNVTLEYSCCDRVCIINYLNTNNNIEEQKAMEDESKTILPVEFIQTKKTKINLKNKNKMKNNNKELFVDGLLKRVGLMKDDDKDSKEKNPIIASGAEIFEIFGFDENTINFDNNDIEKLKSAEKSFKAINSTLKLNDENLSKTISEFIQNKDNFVVDERILKSISILNLNVTQKENNNTNLVSLKGFIDSLHKKDQSFFLTCREANCKLTANNEELSYDLKANFDYRDLNKTEIKDIKNNSTKKDGSILDTVSNFFFKKSPSDIEKETNEKLKNTFNLKLPSHFNSYHRPDYRDLNSTYNFSSLDFGLIQNIIQADVSRLSVGYLPEFDKNDFINNLNANYAKGFKLDLKCSEYFCVLDVNTDISIFKSTDPNKKTFFMTVTQRKPFTFSTSNLSLTQKKCVIKNVLLNQKDGESKNAKVDILSKCNLDTPYVSLPISETCLVNFVGQCKKTNFFELYNRYTKGVASYEDLPSEKALVNSCSAPVECSTLTTKSTDDEKAKCGETISRMILVNSLKISFVKLINPCNGEVPAASVQPISFVGMKKKMRKSTQVTSSKSDVVDLNSLTDKDKQIVQSTTQVASENLDSTLSIDGVNSNSSSVNVEADLSEINKSVDDTINAVKENIVAQKSETSGVDKVKYGFFTVIFVLATLMF